MRYNCPWKWHTCDECDVRIKITSTPLHCEVPECDKVCHPYVTCSTIPPYNTTRKWTCADHWDGISPHRCSVCRKIHKGKDPPLNCLRCHKICHRVKKCSNINLNVADPTWLCNEHTEEQTVDIPPEVAPQLPSCYICKKE